MQAANGHEARPFNDDWNLRRLVRMSNWNEAEERCKNHPEEVRMIDPLNGTSVLHLLCYNSTSPIHLIRLVVEAWPEATDVQELTYLATPLHVLGWSSQRSVSKVELILQHMDETSLFRRNRMGGTALHSACGSNAMLEVIVKIVRACPSIVLERTTDQHTALSALWQSHLQTIPGHMAVARILEGDDVQDGHFIRFFEKALFLATTAAEILPNCKDTNLFHGLMELRAPLNLLKVAIRRNPEFASQTDRLGNFPLHLVVERRPFRIKDSELIKDLVEAYPKAVSKRNKQGDTPLLIAIRDKMSWDEGIDVIVDGDVEAVSFVDPKTKLYPFLLAAEIGGRVAVETTFNLLCLGPHLVRGAIPAESESSKEFT